MKTTVFWDIAPCSLDETDRGFRGAYCLHYQSAPLKRRSTSTTLHGAIFQTADCHLHSKTETVRKQSSEGIISTKVRGSNRTTEKCIV
jgi:hypothetical protein